MLGPARANDCECFFELGGGDLLPAPTRQELKPPRPVQSESLETPEPAPPRAFAGEFLQSENDWQVISGGERERGVWR
jgi:hypothetical protein